mmetsp:Transcript_7098/g.21603  ORF Transcript_7098/g.21603 Transcript_7098/m.21603 type:complete len:243 (+) Transcript_7098:127-855(+)
MSRPSPSNRRSSTAKKGGAEDVPSGPRAKEKFAVNAKPHPVRSTRPAPFESEEMANRVARFDVQPAVLPDDVSRSLGLRNTAPLNETVASAAASSGYSVGAKALIKAARKKAQVQSEQDRVPKPPPVGSYDWSEQDLRKMFMHFDLDKNEVVGAKELKQIFAMLGESPTDNEIDGMIYLCDVRGEGQVCFEDFLSIFSNPAESLKNIDRETLRKVVQGQPRKESSSESEDADIPSDSGGSSD